MGAISAVAIAMAADLTRDQHRTKAMAIIGSMIGVAFAASLVLGPWLDRHIGVPGIFMLIGVLAVAAMLVVATLPSAQQIAPGKDREMARFGEILRDRELNRLNVGIFVLHAVLMSLFVTVPLDLIAAGLPTAAHWQVYAAVMGGAFILMVPAIQIGERKERGKAVFILCIALVTSSQVLLGLSGSLHAQACWCSSWASWCWRRSCPRSSRAPHRRTDAAQPSPSTARSSSSAHSAAGHSAE
jgi:predicted MFS family arabinose efflux permease